MQMKLEINMVYISRNSADKNLSISRFATDNFSDLIVKNRKDHDDYTQQESKLRYLLIIL